MSSNVNPWTWRADPDLSADVAAELARWERDELHIRLWNRDAQLWTGADEARWLGWLDAVRVGQDSRSELEALQAEVQADAFTHALLLGMGGSSLCPEVLARSFGVQPGFPALHVLDSTDPGQVLTFEGKVDLARTIVCVASKSGSTLEPNIFERYFFDRMRGATGGDHAGHNFLAITDPGSALEKLAREEGFRRVALGDPTIGGRYSALSPFGLVPAAVMGIDVAAFLDRAAAMVSACGRQAPPRDNPGICLGIVLGAAARRGRDKLTVLASPPIAGLGAWLEQLVAESTGKNGVGIIPVDLEEPGRPDRYGADRMFVYLRAHQASTGPQDHAVRGLEQAGHPVVRVDVHGPLTLGQEFFRWEMATAVAGQLLGIHPFDQPDVEASKVATRALTEAYERDGALPVEKPLATDGEIAIFADPGNARALASASQRVERLIGEHLARLGTNDYFALLAYVEMNARHAGVLQQIRHLVRDRRHVATCLGFGPRFLHSTGQAYKGGPPSGVFLQITCDDARDVRVPGREYTFGVVKAAQARGDFDVLAQRGRRALRVHVGADVAAGLERLRDHVGQGL
jgi:transaldolase / glucose-6-phosphate isomerase